MRLAAVSTACFAAVLSAQTTPSNAELLEALAHSATIFSSTVPFLTARETLVQRGRQGTMEIEQDKRDRVKYMDFSVPPNFQTHEIVSEYGFGRVGDSSGLHEVRRPVAVDGVAAASAEARHALTLGVQSPEDGTKKQLLENLEHGALTGSITDFGQVLLLFTQGRQRDYTFAAKGQKNLGGEPVFVLRYRQISGEGGVTEFRERARAQHRADGQIWLRAEDLIPLRITVETEEVLSTRYKLRNEAEVNYKPTRFGLAPATIVHKQFLNEDLLVENCFSYSGYSGRAPIP